MQNFRKQMQNQFNKMVQTGKLFTSDISGTTIWDVFLNSFENDPIFRDPLSSTHNCNLCNNFIRRYGNIIAVDEDLNIITLWDFIPENEEYINVNKNLSALIKDSNIKDVFFETLDNLKSLPYESIKKGQETFKLGIDKNIKRYTKEEAELYPDAGIKKDDILTFNHLSLQIPSKFVSERKESIDAILAEYRDAKFVFKRGMDEIHLDTLNLVSDLIKQGSLLDGTSHLIKIKEIIPLAKTYQSIPENKKDIWAWVNSYKKPFAKFRNSLIGVLCTELSEGVELNKACENWNKRVDPINYMKATAPITQKQIKEAQIFVDDNGYTSAFSRRSATIEDIAVNEILHLNSEGGDVQKDVHIFDSITPTKSTRHKKSEFDKVEEVSIEKFMYEILPTCTSVEAFLTNNHESNMVTLTTSKDKNSKQIFKWNNPFSWTFNGNLAGKSMIKSAVKSQGGKVDGVLRFSIMWANNSEDDSDLDAHCIEVPGSHIYFGNKVSMETKGNLDIDIINPQMHKQHTKKDVVENITYPEYPKEKTSFEFYVHNYSNRNSRGFNAEIEFKGIQFQYTYDRPLRQGQKVNIATVIYENGDFNILHHLQPSDGYNVEKEIYNLKTGHFHKVNLVCLSPNHWGENNVGNKYYFFFLEGAQSKTNIRSFHNENLKSELLTHRKVMEVLGNTTMVKSVTNELSGIGFNSTVKDELIVRLKGSHKRIIKIKF